MKEEYDVIIIGAGPAGLNCAIELGKSNLSILLLEKNEIIGPKICAGGLTTKIEKVGIPLDSAEMLFSSVTLSLSDKSVAVSPGTEPFIGTIDRGKLGQLMLGELSDRVEIRKNARVDKIEDSWILVGEEKIRYKYLVGADGSNSVVRRYLGLKNNKLFIAIQYLLPDKFSDLEFSIEPDIFGSGYAWIFPHKEYVSVGCGMDFRYSDYPSLKENFATWLSHRGIDVRDSKMQGGVINFDFQGFQFGDKFLVGDAGGFASGLTGEGIYFALVSGRDVARKIIDSQYGCQRIKEIMKIKKRHEFLHKFVSRSTQLSGPVSKILLRTFLYLSKYRWFSKRIINNYYV